MSCVRTRGAGRKPRRNEPALSVPPPALVRVLRWVVEPARACPPPPLEKLLKLPIPLEDDEFPRDRNWPLLEYCPPPDDPAWLLPIMPR